MKLATLDNGTRDGKLVVVNQDLLWYTDISHMVPTLQYAIDNWSECSPILQQAANGLASDSVPRDRFRERAARAPLPRAFQWIDGSAYVNHVELVRKARGVDMPDSFWTDPLMYQGGSDSFLGPRDAICLADEQWGIDLEAEVAVIVDDVPMGASAEVAATKIRLIMLVNDISLRNLIPPELGKGFGFMQSKPSTAFSPVAATPDELGASWSDGKVHLPVLVDYNNKPFGRANAGVDMIFNFPQLIAHAAKTRPLVAGSIIGSGTVSNKLNGEPGKPVGDGGAGFSCIAEQRTIETINNGKPTTPFMRFGDKVRIEMHDADGHSVFGAIEQTVVQFTEGDSIN